MTADLCVAMGEASGLLTLLSNLGLTMSEALELANDEIREMMLPVAILIWESEDLVPSEVAAEVTRLCLNARS